jgi:O-antigen ligase
MSNNVRKTTLKISPVAIYGLPLITLYFSVTLNDPFNVPKFILLILVSSFLLVNLLIMYRSMPVDKPGIEFWAIVIITIFLGFQFLSLLFSNNLITALFGETQRRLGFLTYISFAIILLYILRLSRIASPINILKSLMVGSAGVLIYSLVQISGNDFIDWINPYNNAISTLGNPNFTSAFLAIAFTGAVSYLLTYQKQKSFSFLALVIIFFSPLIIYSSQSRQGFYAMAVGLLTYFNLLFYLKKYKFRIIVHIFTLIICLFSVAGMLQSGPLSSMLYKESVSVRGFYWRAGFQMFIDNPIVGVGLDSYGLFFRQYKELDYVQRFGTELTSTNAHNTPIQLLSTGGLFVGISYLALVSLVVMSAILYLKSSAKLIDKKIMLGMLATFITYLAQSIISIDNIGTTVWGWTLAGAILGLSSQTIGLNSKLKEKVETNRVSLQLKLIKPFMIFITLVPTSITSIYLYNSESSMYSLRSIADPNIPGNVDSVVSYAEKILNNPIADPLLKVKSALYLGEMGRLEKGYTEMRNLYENNTINFEVLWSLAAFQKQIGDIKSTIDTRIQISRVDPFNTNNYLLLIELYLSQGNSSKAMELKDKIILLNPGSLDAKKARDLVG